MGIKYRRADQSDEQRQKRRAVNGGGIAGIELLFHRRTILLERRPFDAAA
jgi:hypothetical protein